VGDSLSQIDRELSLTEIFGRTYEVFKKYYTSVLPIFLAFGFVSTILASYISYITPSPPVPANLADLTNGEVSSMVGIVSKYVGYTLANYFVSWCILYFAAALGILRMSRYFEEAQSRPNYAALALTTVISVAIIEAGIFLIVVGALVFATMLYLVLVAATVEGRSIRSAIGRSRQLVSGNWLKTFLTLAGVQLTIAVISSLIGGIAGLPFSGEASTMAGVIASNFATALLFPLVSASMLVVYYSNRAKGVKKEKRVPSPYDDMKPQPISGFPISRNVYCPSCSSSVTSEEKFCHNCGMQLQV
jgi:hypothetical protein